MPSGKERDVYYISAPSNAGKSYLAAEILFRYHNLNKKNKIILINPEDQEEFRDKAYENIDFFQLDVEECFSEENPNFFKEFNNSMVVFDDIEGFQDKKIIENVYKFLNDILYVGRKRGISCILNNHVLKNHNKTKSILRESDYIIIFPQMANKFIYNNLLERDFNFPKPLISKIYTLPSRWVAIHSKCPNYILYQKGLFSI